MFKMRVHKMQYVKILVIALVFMFSCSSVFAIDGVWHKPLGYENFYATGGDE